MSVFIKNKQLDLNQTKSVKRVYLVGKHRNFKYRVVIHISIEIYILREEICSTPPIIEIILYVIVISENLCSPIPHFPAYRGKFVCK